MALVRRDTTRGPARRDAARSPEQRRTDMQARMRDGLKQRFGLTDAQVAKFEETNKRFGEKHRLLQDQERDIRMALREEQLSDKPRDAKLNELLDKQIATRRQAVDLGEQREKELAGFLTPQQRVKLTAARGAMKGRRGGPGGPGGRMAKMRGMRAGQGMGRGGFGPGGMGPGAMGPGRMGPDGQGPNAQRRPMRPPMGEPQDKPVVPPTF